MATISFMTADIATPPTSGWQALASNFASDSAILISRLLLLFIFITIAVFGLHLNYMRNRSSVAAPTSSSSTTGPPSATDGTGEQPQEGIQMNNLLDVAAIALNASS
ncbi:hypothetical protein BDL97_12G006100 [Sphagnum fallax]|nr:hypothetical protein BDL97_12G006100 [Sphagnum fallax]